MIKSAVTVSLVQEARGGPFVYWDDLPAAIERSQALGFDAVELFLPGPDAVPVPELHALLKSSGQGVAAVGTGAGMVVHQLSLSDPDEGRRSAAIEFVKKMIRFGGEFRAPAIIGSMQGRWKPEIGKVNTLNLLADSLQILGQVASEYGVPLIYEPLNRYETNLCNTQQEGVDFLQQRGIENVLLLADLFHMNIEETSIADGLRAGGKYIGHVHFVDSNRRPAGCGHLDFSPVVSALHEIDYQGYVSAEAFPWPDSEQAAAQTMQTFRHVFGR
ncbi:TIM barrel protein [Planctomicrobium sp. SH661]|uniref:TIM barrel protein n=1 Tax=Planctomicrobium sp. SH661 TaxID=3448124 RepID=UPI003F5C2AC9